jgi:ubiquinone/menaquinone biosynthesis C-methylase UbiE
MSGRSPARPIGSVIAEAAASSKEAKVPTIDDNRAKWDGYDWSGGGDEWSSHWGGVETHWHATVLPRIRPFVPTGTVCEIAPGRGRWSQYLIGLCERYVGVDLTPGCVEACRKRFASDEHASFEVTDGTSLPMLEATSVDFVFSFDSLVHAEADVIAAYLGELARVLAPDGIAFLHHSNLGEFDQALHRTKYAEQLARRVPGLQTPLRKRELIGWQGLRAESMTAARFVEMANAAGLVCVGQEIVNWATWRLIDCMSLATRPGSVWDRPNVVRRNQHFMNEGHSARSLAEVFTSMASTVQGRTGCD